MAHMGLRLAQRANGILLAAWGRVSRAMFSELWCGFDHDEVALSGRSPMACMHAPALRHNGCSWGVNWPGRIRLVTPAFGYDCNRSIRAICGESARN